MENTYIINGQWKIWFIPMTRKRSNISIILSLNYPYKPSCGEIHEVYLKNVKVHSSLKKEVLNHKIFTMNKVVTYFINCVALDAIFLYFIMNDYCYVPYPKILFNIDQSLYESI